MKKVFLAIAIAFSVAIFAQEKEEKEVKSKIVPVVVKAAFKKDFPNTKVSWDAENGGYEAEFKLNGVDASAEYDKMGHQKALEVSIKTNGLPATALVYLKKNYSTNKITEAAKITNDKKVITYEAEIRSKGKSMDVIFDVDGKFIKTESGD